MKKKLPVPQQMEQDIERLKLEQFEKDLRILLEQTLLSDLKKADVVNKVLREKEMTELDSLLQGLDVFNVEQFITKRNK